MTPRFPFDRRPHRARIHARTARLRGLAEVARRREWARADAPTEAFNQQLAAFIQEWEGEVGLAFQRQCSLMRAGLAGRDGGMEP
jgi:hypothetical protein